MTMSISISIIIRAILIIGRNEVTLETNRVYKLLGFLVE